MAYNPIGDKTLENVQTSRPNPMKEGIYAKTTKQTPSFLGAIIFMIIILCGAFLAAAYFYDQPIF